MYLHGTPDCRLARHPDDGLAVAAGVRLLAVDRLGLGATALDTEGTIGSFADDVAALLDHLSIERCSVVAWSAGSIYGLGLAARHPTRVNHVGIAASLVPFAAYADPPS